MDDRVKDITAARLPAVNQDQDLAVSIPHVLGETGGTDGFTSVCRKLVNDHPAFPEPFLQGLGIPAWSA